MNCLQEIPRMAARELDQLALEDADESFEIDVNRVVWDPDYRQHVMEELKRHDETEYSA